MRITYASKRLERLFDDYGELQKRLPAEWVRTIKKHIDRLKAAEAFGDFLKLNLGHPEPMRGKDTGKYSVRITGNVRLIIRPIESGNVIELEGVVDYHGGKETWFIP